MISTWITLTPIRYTAKGEMIEGSIVSIRIDSIEEIADYPDHKNNSRIVTRLNEWNNNLGESYNNFKESREEILQKIREAELEALKVFLQYYNNL